MRITVGDVIFFCSLYGLSGIISQALINSTYGDFERCGKYWVDTLPQPMTPTFIFLFSDKANDSKEDNNMAAPANVVRCKNSWRDILFINKKFIDKYF